MTGTGDFIEYYDGAFYISALDHAGTGWVVNGDLVASGQGTGEGGYAIDETHHYFADNLHELRVYLRSDQSAVAQLAWQTQGGTDEVADMATDSSLTSARKLWVMASDGNDLQVLTYELSGTTLHHRQSFDFTLAALNTLFGTIYEDLDAAVDSSDVVGFTALTVRETELHLFAVLYHTDSRRFHTVAIPYTIGGTGNALTLTAGDSLRIFAESVRPSSAVHYDTNRFALIDDSQFLHYTELLASDNVPEPEAGDSGKVIGVNDDLQYELVSAADVGGEIDSGDASVGDVLTADGAMGSAFVAPVAAPITVAVADVTRVSRIENAIQLNIASAGTFQSITDLLAPPEGFTHIVAHFGEVASTAGGTPPGFAAIIPAALFLGITASSVAGVAAAGNYVILRDFYDATANTATANLTARDILLGRTADNVPLFTGADASEDIYGGTWTYVTEEAVSVVTGVTAGGQQAAASANGLTVRDIVTSTHTLTEYDTGTAWGSVNGAGLPFTSVPKVDLDRFEIGIWVNALYLQPIIITRGMLEYIGATAEPILPTATSATKLAAFFVSGRDVESTDSREPLLARPSLGFINDRRLAARYGLLISFNDNNAGDAWNQIAFKCSSDYEIDINYVRAYYYQTI